MLCQPPSPTPHPPTHSLVASIRRSLARAFPLSRWLGSGARSLALSPRVNRFFSPPPPPSPPTHPKLAHSLSRSLPRSGARSLARSLSLCFGSRSIASSPALARFLFPAGSDPALARSRAPPPHTHSLSLVASIRRSLASAFPFSRWLGSRTRSPARSHHTHSLSLSLSLSFLRSGARSLARSLFRVGSDPALARPRALHASVRPLASQMLCKTQNASYGPRGGRLHKILEDPRPGSQERLRGAAPCSPRTLQIASSLFNII